MNRNFIVAAAAACALALPAGAQQKRAFTIPDLYRVKSVSNVQLSPDSKTLAYTTGSSNLKEHKSYSNVCLMGTDGKGAKSLTTDGKSSLTGWSADGKTVYYTSETDGNQQLWAYTMATGKSRQVTNYGLGVDGPVVSPDGRYVAFAADVYPELGAEAAANKDWRKKKDDGPVQAHMADALLYRHWTSYNDGRYAHLIVLDTQSGTYTDVTPGKYELTFSLGGDVRYAFSPDSRELCFVSNHSKHPEANTNADLWLVPVTGGEAKCITEANKAWDGSPAYSPDGRYIAYRTQLVEGYESDRFRLAIYDRKSGERRIVTDSFDNWVTDFKWAADSRSIYFIGTVQGAQPLYRLDLAKGAITPAVTGKAITSYAFDAKGNFYYTYSTTGRPVALYKQAKGREQQLTFLNAELESEVDIRPSESIWVDGAGGDKVQVFIVKPHNFDPSKRYPLVLNIHGGPQQMWMNSFRGDWQVYPGAGYVVAYPNIHGSNGYGQAFCRAISGDWGGKAFEDVMLVTDALAKLDYVDSTRMGAMGWSYGGYMMNWLQGHTRRFKCLASMMGVYDLRSMWGTTEELWFPEFELQGRPWTSDMYQKWSPSSYIDRFATPTLIITGERDYRVSYTQSLQYFTALQSRDIPSRLIVFKNDGHWPNTLKSMPVYYNAHLDWFHRYLGGDPAPWDVTKQINNQIEY